MRINKIIIVVSLIIFSLNKISATAQAPDYLIIEKDTLKLHCNPLETYFEKNPLPDNTFTTISTGLWRGYIAYFKIKNNKLIVDNIYKIRYYKDDQGNHKEELISNNMSKEEVRTYIEADTLEYLSVEDLVNAIGNDRNYALESFNGDYFVKE